MKPKPIINTESRELRHYKTEIRMSEGEEKDFVGVAAVYDSPSEDLGFIEIIERGFFDEALKNSDTRCYAFHNREKILGRRKAGTLSLDNKDDGIHYRCTNPGTSYANDLKISMLRGDIDQSSFGFVTKATYRGDEIDGDRWEWDENREKWIRYLIPNGCKEFFDVSPVSVPAYKAASAGLRSLEEHQKRSAPPESSTKTFPGKAEYIALINSEWKGLIEDL